MKTSPRVVSAAAGLLFFACPLPRPIRAVEPYRVVTAARVGGAGGYDYVYADSDGRRLYVPRGDRVTVYDLDTLQPAGVISQTPSVHGAVVDPLSHRGFCSSRPVVMWDSQTLAVIKTIAVKGGPDGIFFDAATERVFILSHGKPNVTVIDAKDGAIVGTIDLIGEPEQGVADGQGHLYIDVEDKDKIAVIDANSLLVTGYYDLGGKGGGPAGLALDAKNRILFACCHDPQTMVILNADTGSIITTLPIGKGVDGAEFNPNTLEAFSSQREGTLTVVKENSPTDFVVEQNVATKAGARTSTLDVKTNQIYLITADEVPNPQAAAVPVTAPVAAATSADASAAPPAGQPAPQPQPRRRGGKMVPDSFTILVVGK